MTAAGEVTGFISMPRCFQYLTSNFCNVWSVETALNSPLLIKSICKKTMLCCNPVIICERKKWWVRCRKAVVMLARDVKWEGVRGLLDADLNPLHNHNSTNWQTHADWQVVNWVLTSSHSPHDHIFSLDKTAYYVHLYKKLNFRTLVDKTILQRPY